MIKKFTVLSLIGILITVMLTACGSVNEANLTANSTPENTADKADKTTVDISYSSIEEAYYSKYTELAEKYGTNSVSDWYNTNGLYTEHSYLSGVCVVNQMDFNMDGIDDLFVVYSTGQMSKIISDSSDLEIYDFPTEDTYAFEIWTYKDGALMQLLHENRVSACAEYPNNESIFLQKYYQLFISVYENSDGFPVIQIYDDRGENRKYTNIYYSDGQIINDEFVYNGDTLMMNGFEIAEEAWSRHVAGFDKILLYALLADTSNSSDTLLDAYNMDYNNTISQTQRVVRYLQQKESIPQMPRFNIAEGEYISLYLQELERANRVRINEEFTENHYSALYDIDQDGVPELILHEQSSGAGEHHHFYTVINNEAVDCGDYGRATLYADGDGGIIAYYARMDSYAIKKITLNGGTILITDIAAGYTREAYPELKDLGYNNYTPLAFCLPAIPQALYTYGQELPLY